MHEINSDQNPLIKKYRSLYLKKYRDKYNLFITIGSKTTLEAVKCFKCEALLTTDKKLFKNQSIENKILISEKVLRSFYKNKMSQPLIGIFKKEKQSEPKFNSKILVLDNIQDPVNMGSILRDCLAFDIKNVFITTDSVDPYNYKVLKGATNPKIYKNIYLIDRKSICNQLKINNYKIIITSPRDGENIIKIDNRSAVIIGNEGKGINERFIKISDSKLLIKINKSLESLSASSATTIIIYKLFNSYE